MSTTTRLNADIRSAILTNAIKMTLWVKLNEALLERSALAEEVRQLSFGGKIAEVEEKLHKAQEQAEELSAITGQSISVSHSHLKGSALTANIDGMHIELLFAESYRLLIHELKETRINYRANDTYKISEGIYHRARIVVKDEDLKSRVMKNVELIRSLEETASTVIPTIAALLRKAPTLEKLIQLWSEVEKYIPEDLTASSKQVTNLPISISDLNTKLASLAA